MSARGRRRPAAARVLLPLLTAAATPAAAQLAPVDGPPVTAETPARTFGEPLHWRNAVRADRLPRRERPLGSSVLRAPNPPPRTFEPGLRARFSAAAEITDNVFFTADDRESDVILTATPGLEYLDAGANWSLFADAAVEAAWFAEQSDEAEAINGIAAAAAYTYDWSERLAFDGVNSYVESRQVEESLVPGALPAFTRTRTNVFVATARGRPSERVTASAAYRNTLQFSDADDLSDIVEHGAEALAEWELDERVRLGGRYDVAVLDYSRGDREWIQAARGSATVEWNERLVLAARSGVITTDADDGRVFADVGGSIALSWENLVLTLEGGRELFAVVGVEEPVLNSEVALAALARLDRGLILDARLVNRWLTVLDDDDTEVTSTQAEARLSYAVGDDLWLWARYRFTRDDPEGDDPTNANRLLVGITRDF